MADPPEYHRILERQLRRLGLSTVDPPDAVSWPDLLALVSSSYHEADADRYTLERSIEISSNEMRALHEVLTERARHDTLTGLPNRSALADYLGDALERRQFATGDVAVLFVDLDNFKLVNDSLGHSAGDALLVGVAERIRSAVRDNDVVARLGGDEFVVVCTDVDRAETAIAIARRISAALERPISVGDEETVIGASIGIAFAGTRPATSDDLLREADIAMYDAKTVGQGPYVIFDAAMRRRVEGKLTTANALRSAVGNNEFELEYQPIVRLADQRLVGMEALTRWHRPGHGTVLPYEFIPIAEQSRLITNIDAWVVRTACQQAAAWDRPDLAIAVNISAYDLQRPSTVDTISEELELANLRPTQLTIEITESALVAEDISIATSLARIKKLGVRLAIDDFGTGYSSFTYLRRLPAHILKIDRSFVALLDDDPSVRAIAAAIIDMGHALGLTVIAEGVETGNQANRLRALRCDAAQGFLFARPQPAAAFDAYFARTPPGQASRWRPHELVGDTDPEPSLTQPD